MAHHSVRRSQAEVPVHARARGSRGREPPSRPFHSSRTWTSRATSSTPSWRGTSWPTRPSRPSPRSSAAPTPDDRGLAESAGLYAATGFQATSRDDRENMSRPVPDVRHPLRVLPARGPPVRRRRLAWCSCASHGAAKSVVAAAQFQATGRGPGPRRSARWRPAPSPTPSWRRGRCRAAPAEGLAAGSGPAPAGDAL